MRFIPTTVHGVMDYAIGVVLILAPWLLGFANGGPEQWVPVILGAAAIIYSLLTDYELGALKVIPMTGHLTIDFLSGALLAVSPWLFGFSEVVFLPHLIVGLIEMGAALTTHTTPHAHDRMVPRATTA